MLEKVTVINKFLNTKRRLFAIVPKGDYTDDEVIKAVKDNEPYLRRDETFEVEGRQAISPADVLIIKGRMDTIVLPSKANSRGKRVGA